MKKQDADSILQKHFPACPTLLADLIDNNVLLKTKSQAREENEDCVVFCYQRISDFIIARVLVQQYQNWESFARVINTDNVLRAIFVESHWSCKGILEALAILIPEVFGHEVTDLIKFIPKTELKRKFYLCLDLISDALINSFLIRRLFQANGLRLLLRYRSYASASYQVPALTVLRTP